MTGKLRFERIRWAPKGGDRALLEKGGGAFSTKVAGYAAKKNGPRHEEKEKLTEVGDLSQQTRRRYHVVRHARKRRGVLETRPSIKKVG